MACIEKGATGKNLYEQIDNMPVDEALKKLAHKIRFWGNAGAHPDIILGQHITEEDALLAIDFAEKFLDFVYIIPADLKALETKAIHDGKEK